MIGEVSILCFSAVLFFFFKQKTAYEMRISDWSSDVCSSDLVAERLLRGSLAIQTGTTDPHGCLGVISAVGCTIQADSIRDDVSARRASRSEERRVGKECVSTCRYRWSPCH